MMGAGKSTLGRRLASVLDLPFIDLDSEIESRSGVTIAELFAREGEAGFRQRESRVLEEAIEQLTVRPAVVSCGGGVVCSPTNLQLLRDAPIPILYLHATPKVLYARLRHDRKRPLLQNVDPSGTLERLYAARHPLYLEVADHRIDVDERAQISMRNLIATLTTQATQQ